MTTKPLRSNPVSPFIPVLCFIFFSFGLTAFPDLVRNNLTVDITYCLTTLVPSLFPFIALTSYAVNSPVNDFFTKYFGFIAKYIFRLPKVCTVTILMGLLGGYPSGAAGVSSLLENSEITKKEASRLLFFCVNPGIAYVITYAGITVLNNKKAGLMLFCSILAASILMGIVQGLFFSIPENDKTFTVKTHENAIIKSASNASLAMVRMISCILLFSSFIAILQGSGILNFISSWTGTHIHIPFKTAESFLLMLLEITRGFRISAENHTPVMLYALTLAFAGICVHLQIFSFFGEFPMAKWKFILSRLLHGILSAVIFLSLLKLFPDTQMVFFSSIDPKTVVSTGLSTTLSGGISLLAMCAAFLLILQQNRSTDPPQIK